LTEHRMLVYWRDNVYVMDGRTDRHRAVKW